MSITGAPSGAARSYRNHSHCAYCGHAFAEAETWPRTCRQCGNTSFRNPIPVAVLLIPVGDGVVVIRRGIPPRQGSFALPGGFIEWGETWQQAGVREAREEAGVVVDPASIQLVTVFSSTDGTLIIVGQTAALDPAALLPFQPTPEAPERHILSAPAPLAWQLHSDVIANYFAARRR